MDDQPKDDRGLPAAGSSRQRGVRGRRHWLRLLPAAAVLAALIDFVLQNTRTVRLHAIVWSANTHIGWALLIAGILGIVIGLLLPSLRRFV